jgi:hypothetical protein
VTAVPGIWGLQVDRSTGRPAVSRGSKKTCKKTFNFPCVLLKKQGFLRERQASDTKTSLPTGRPVWFLLHHWRHAPETKACRRGRGGVAAA